MSVFVFVGKVSLLLFSLVIGFCARLVKENVFLDTSHLLEKTIFVLMLLFWHFWHSQCFMYLMFRLRLINFYS